MESVQTLGVPDEEKTSKLPGEEISAIGAELAEDTVKRRRDAAEMGHVKTLKAIADEFKNQLDSFVQLCKQIVQMAEDFDLDGVQKLTDDLDAC